MVAGPDRNNRLTPSAHSTDRRPTPTVLHLDVDAFFASVEQLLFPALRNRPVAVGNGVIASCSYEARASGLSAGMPLGRARARCRGLVVLDGSYPTYRCFAEHVWAICRRYVTALETFLDEACGNATGIAEHYGGPRELGLRIQREVREEVGLPVSVGLASNRMMAKIGSGLEKPYGVVAIPPGREQRFLAPLPIDKLPGVGAKTHRILRDMNVATIGEIAALPRELLRSMLGYRGELIHDRAQGRDGRAIRADALPKSISRETTFHQPLRDDGPIRGMIFYLLQRATRAARDDRLVAERVELSIRYDDWKQVNAARTLPDATDSEETLFAVTCELLDRLYTRRVALRHVRVILGNLSPAGNHVPLLEHETRRQERRLHAAVDTIRDRWGHSCLVSGKSIELLGELKQNDHGFVLRTPSLTK